MHLHGVNVPNSMDGVAPVTQNRLETGETFTCTATGSEGRQSELTFTFSSDDGTIDDSSVSET